MEGGGVMKPNLYANGIGLLLNFGYFPIYMKGF